VCGVCGACARRGRGHGDQQGVHPVQGGQVRAGARALQKGPADPGLPARYLVQYCRVLLQAEAV